MTNQQPHAVGGLTVLQVLCCLQGAPTTCWQAWHDGILLLLSLLCGTGDRTWVGLTYAKHVS